jgi:hypothetical protein
MVVRGWVGGKWQGVSSIVSHVTKGGPDFQTDRLLASFLLPSIIGVEHVNKIVLGSLVQE